MRKQIKLEWVVMSIDLTQQRYTNTFGGRKKHKFPIICKICTCTPISCFKVNTFLQEMVWKFCQKNFNAWGDKLDLNYWGFRLFEGTKIVTPSSHIRFFEKRTSNQQPKTVCKTANYQKKRWKHPKSFSSMQFSSVSERENVLRTVTSSSAALFSIHEQKYRTRPTRLKQQQWARASN